MPLDPAQSAASLCAFVEKLRSEIVNDGESLFAEWQSGTMPDEFLPSARNLAHYLSLRRADLRQMQPALRALGLSTLGRSEPHVLASIDAVFASLGLRKSSKTSSRRAWPRAPRRRMPPWPSAPSA